MLGWAALSGLGLLLFITVELRSAHPMFDFSVFRIRDFSGAIIGCVSWVMVAYVGIDGVKMLSNLGGLPGMNRRRGGR